MVTKWGENREKRGEKTRRKMTGNCRLDEGKDSVKQDSKIQVAESKKDSKMMPTF